MSDKLYGRGVKHWHNITSMVETIHPFSSIIVDTLCGQNISVVAVKDDLNLSPGQEFCPACKIVMDGEPIKELVTRYLVSMEAVHQRVDVSMKAHKAHEARHTRDTLRATRRADRDELDHYLMMINIEDELYHAVGRPFPKS